mgnify:CR=1 FL=1
MTPPEKPPEPPEPPPPDRPIVPDWDVRNCMVCGQPMEGRKCKYVCTRCGTMIDCSDAY